MVPDLPACLGHAPHLTLAVLDVSDSVISSNGADRNGRSFEETIRLAEVLAEKPCSDEDRLGAVIFASLVVEVPPTQLTSHSVISAAIKRPPHSEIGGSTNLTAALDQVVQIVQRFSEYRSTVVVLSDMQADDSASVNDRLRRLGLVADLHLVALGSGPETSNDGQFLSVTRLVQVNRGDVANAMAAAIASTRTTNGNP